MTGFGKAVRENAGARIAVEVSSVNHRYLDIQLRLPSGWAALEIPLREKVKAHVARGKIYCSISCQRDAQNGQTVRFDRAVAQQYLEASRELGSMIDAPSSLSLSDLAHMEGVFYFEERDEDPESLREEVTAVLEDALVKLDAMRTTEGAALAEELRARVAAIREFLDEVERRLPGVNARYEQRLRERVAELAADTALTEERLAVEVAVMAEKGDVTEEIVRIRAHLIHFEEFLQSETPVGRELNFLTQELGREINTLGVKVRDTDVAKQTFEMKAELEKMREQIQNLE